LIWWGLVALAVGVWALLRRGGDGDGDGPDLGTMSGQWLAEHRAHERESDKR
jgi:hypothetical protein